MSIAFQNQIDELKRRVAALEEAQRAPVAGQQHMDEVSYVVPEALKGKTLTLPEKRKSA